MIRFENTEVVGWEAAIRGMRNPMNSWERSDSWFNDGYDSDPGFVECHDICGNLEQFDMDEPEFFREDVKIGQNDHDLMMRLAKSGSEHAKYRRMIVCYVDITAPLYFWKEFDTYKVGTVANSCSTMHKIAEKEFKVEDFSTDHLFSEELDALIDIIKVLNGCRQLYLDGKRKADWWQMIQLLPSSYNQRRTVMLNYEVLAGIYRQRKGHKLDEWREGFIQWIESLPYSEIITGEEK